MEQLLTVCVLVSLAVMEMTPPESVYEYGGYGMKMSNRVVALGAFAATGGAC